MADAPAGKRQKATPPLEGKHIGILIDFQFEDLEATYPNLRLQEAGADLPPPTTGPPSHGPTHQLEPNHPNVHTHHRRRPPTFVPGVGG